MEMIILFLIALCIGLIIGYCIKRIKQKQLDYAKLQEYEYYIKQRTEKISAIDYEIKNREGIINQLDGEIKQLDNTLGLLRTATNDMQNHYEQLSHQLQIQQDTELKIYYENRMGEIKSNIQKADQELHENYEQNKLKYDKEIEAIKKELENYKAARRAIIEEQKRQEEMQDNQKFYMLQISNTDIEDIKQLRLLEPRLHNKEILNKLIWSTFYQTPYKNLIGRLFGTREISGIYKITSISTNKAYIGKSVNVAKRFSEHIKSSLEISNIAKNQLYTLMKEKGAEDFTFELLEEVNKDKLLERESYWIKFYETNSYGLNMKE